MLIDARHLSENLPDPAWIVFDCRHDLLDAQRGARVYREGHVPGAHFAPVETALSGAKNGRNGRHPLPVAAGFAGFLNRHGVTADTRLVAYDDAGGQYAARFWWLARWIGLSRVAVLDGGLPRWLTGGFPVATTIPVPRGGGTVCARPNDTRVVSAAEVLERLNAGASRMLDARAPERFRGESEPIDPVAGRIPSARNRFFKLNVKPDLTLRPAAELKREFETVLGDWRPVDVVHYCGSGVTACANLLAMEHAGLTGSKLYGGSWSEWIADPARPVERG